MPANPASANVPSAHLVMLRQSAEVRGGHIARKTAEHFGYPLAGDRRPGRDEWTGPIIVFPLLGAMSVIGCRIGWNIQRVAWRQIRQSAPNENGVRPTRA